MRVDVLMRCVYVERVCIYCVVCLPARDYTAHVLPYLINNNDSGKSTTRDFRFLSVKRAYLARPPPKAPLTIPLIIPIMSDYTFSRRGETIYIHFFFSVLEK